jgi:hypothetical protein
MNYRITCPGCGRPLHVPPEAVGRPAHCPHCRTAFHLPAGPGGAPGDPRPIRRPPGLPRPLTVPALGLILLGFAGTLVNGYLSARFALEPGFDREYARGRVREVRAIRALPGGTRGTDEWPHAPRAAVSGAAAAAATVEAVEDLEEELLANAWSEGVLRPVHWYSTAVSLLAMLGGVAIVRGRWYPLAVAGCVAAIVNVNHLCCLPGAVAGVWGLAVLARDDVRAYFKGRGAGGKGPE